MHRAFWISFIFATGVYLSMVFWSLPFIAGQAGGLAPFDMRPTGYSVTEARAFTQALTEEGRAFYLDVQHKLDFAYPALLAMVLIFGFQLLYRHPWSAVLGILALVAAASDYLENYLVAGILQLPAAEVDPTLVTVASFWTISKSAVHSLCFAALLAGALRKLWRRVLR